MADGVNPADTRECDGYPGLAPDAPRYVPAQFYNVEGRVVPADICPCGDPGDCGECS